MAIDRGRVERHIKLLLGERKVRDVTRADIKRFLQDVSKGKTSIDVKTGLRDRAMVKGGKGTATRTVGLLGGVFTYAIDSGHIDRNPVHGVKRFSDKKGKRYLNQQELVRLGRALQRGLDEKPDPQAIAIVKLLIFTGMRKREIESLCWNEVDFESGYISLGDSKTGQKTVPLNGPAMQILTEVTRMPASDYVFAAFKGDGFYEGVPKVWNKIRKMAEIEEVRLHDLRHSFASIAVSCRSMLGDSTPIGEAHYQTCSPVLSCRR